VNGARILLGLLGLIFLILWGIVSFFAIMWDGWGDGATRMRYAGSARLLLLAPLATFVFYIISALAPMRLRTSLIVGIPLQLPILVNVIQEAREGPAMLLLLAGPACWAIYLKMLALTEEMTRPPQNQFGRRRRYR
jgi:hypothetical protein